MIEKYFTELGLSVISGFAFVFVAWLISIWVEKLMRRVLVRWSKTEPERAAAVARGFKITILVLAFVVLFDELGVNVASLIAALGIFGFALAIGMRTSLTNFFTGVLIYFLKPFDEGDYIAGERVEGIVEDVGMFHTEIVTPGGVFVAVPNAAIWTTRSIKNYSRARHWRVTLAITLERHMPYTELRPTIERVLREDANVVSAIAPHIRITEVTEAAMTMRASVWCDAEHTWDVGQRLKSELRSQLDAAGAKVTEIVIPPKSGTPSSKKNPASSTEKEPQSVTVEPKEALSTTEGPPDTKKRETA